MSYIENYINASKSAEREEITNNVGIRFMTLIPMLFFLEKMRLLQYVALVYILTFVVMGMKRGAILLAAVLTIYFLCYSLKEASQKEKLYLLLLSIVAIVLICMVVADLMDNSAYFNRRVQQTLEGDASGRDSIYSMLWYAFLENAWYCRKFASLKNKIEEETAQCAVVAYCITFFMLSLYFMSYDAMDIFSTMGLGYCVAN